MIYTQNMCTKKTLSVHWKCVRRGSFCKNDVCSSVQTRLPILGHCPEFPALAAIADVSKVGGLQPHAHHFAVLQDRMVRHPLSGLETSTKTVPKNMPWSNRRYQQLPIIDLYIYKLNTKMAQHELSQAPKFKDTRLSHPKIGKQYTNKPSTIKF